MSDTVYQNQSLKSQTNVQSNNQIKKDKPVITQIIRQPSIPQIRISKNNRSSNYQPTPTKLNSEKQITLQQLSRDYTSIESTMLFNSQICLNQFAVQNQVTKPTITISGSIAPQENLSKKQQLKKVNETITQPREIKLKVQTKEDLQISTKSILKDDENDNVNSLNFRTKSLMFGDLAVLNFYRKKVDCNRINHTMQIIQKLNKFKKDDQSQTPSNFPILEINPIKAQLQQQFNPAVPSNQVKLIQIKQDDSDEQNVNKLNFSMNQLTLQNEIQNKKDKAISSKETHFRAPLKQESKRHIQQSLSFNTNIIFDVKESFIQSFPCRSISFSQIQVDTSSKESNSIKMNQKTIEDNQALVIQSVNLNDKFQFAFLVRDKIEINNNQIWLSQTLIKDHNIPIQASEQKDNPIQKLHKFILIRDYDRNVSSSKLPQISQTQLIVNTEQDSFAQQSPLVTKNQFTFEHLRKDQSNESSKIVQEMMPYNFDNEVEITFNDQIQTKDKPQYPTLLEMNRMKIEKIKQIIIGTKSPKDLLKPNLEVKEEIGQKFSSSKLNTVSDASPKFKNLSVHGSKVFDDAIKTVLQKEKLRSSSIDKATMHMQMSKNQSSVLNRFKKIKYLGRGKMSDVYSVIDKKTGMALALKIIQKSLIKSKGLANLVSNEIKIQMYLVHSNILKCFGVIDDIKQIALILELSDQTLHSLIRNQKLSRRQMINILFQILSAINHLHNLGIIHRDIKPENILLCQDVIKLADLGISIRANNSSQYCGTIGYMAPEIKEYQNYTAKVDCYSVGVLIFEMMYQKLPSQTLSQIKNPEKDPLIDLMNNLIEMDQYIRFSCQQALNHEVFKDFKQNQFGKPQLQKEMVRLL